MKNGYARCSTNESKQDINRQVRELKAAGAEIIYLEYEHGDSKVKSQQEAMFAAAQPGDTIITLEVPRITTEDLPTNFIRHYPAYKKGQLNISELARLCDLSRTTTYKYLSLMEE